MTYKDKLKAIFNEHGLSTQLKKLSEEVFELQEALLTNDDIDDIDDITTEFADVMVLLSQIKEVYNLKDDDINSVMKYKINRQCERDGIID